MSGWRIGALQIHQIQAKGTLLGKGVTKEGASPAGKGSQWARTMKVWEKLLGGGGAPGEPHGLHGEGRRICVGMTEKGIASVRAQWRNARMKTTEKQCFEGLVESPWNEGWMGYLRSPQT